MKDKLTTEPTGEAVSLANENITGVWRQTYGFTSIAVTQHGLPAQYEGKELKLELLSFQ